MKETKKSAPGKPEREKMTPEEKADMWGWIQLCLACFTLGFSIATLIAKIAMG